MSSVNRRKQRVRAALKAKAKGKARLSVFRSNQHIYAQIIDDVKGVTLASASSHGCSLQVKSGIEAAKLVGQLIASNAKKVKISSVVFDRGSYLYHGRVKAVAEAARAEGLVF